MKSVKIGSFIKIYKGKKVSFVYDYPKIGSNRYIQIEDLRNNNNLKYTDSSEGVFVDTNDVIIAWDGANAGTIGYSLSGIIGSTLAKLKILEKNVYPPFLGIFLNSKSRYIRDRCTGETILHIRKKILADIQFPILPYEYQKHIVKILDSVDAIRQKRKQAITLLDDYIQSVFLTMFGDPVTNPKGWDVKTIEQFVKKEKYSIKRGPFGGSLKKEIFVNKGYLVYEQYHALNNDFEMERYFIDEVKFDELKAFEVKAGDIIISCSGLYLGKLAIIPKNCKKGIINQALLKITLEQSKMNNIFFVYVFSNKNFRNKFFGNKIGNGMPNFPSINEFKKFNFIYPPIDLQNEFASRVEKMESLKQRMLIQSADLDIEFQALRQKAFKGEFLSISK